jgi:hypothetical protein
MRTLAMILSGLAFLVSVAATIYLLNAPLYQHVETVLTESGEKTIQDTATLVEVNGSWVVYQLCAVTLVSGVPFFVALRRSALQRIVTWVSALLLMAYSIAGSFSIGLAFMPSAILLLIAAIATLFIRKGADADAQATRANTKLGT